MRGGGRGPAAGAPGDEARHFLADFVAGVERGRRESYQSTGGDRR